MDTGTEPPGVAGVTEVSPVEELFILKMSVLLVPIAYPWLESCDSHGGPICIQAGRRGFRGLFLSGVRKPGERSESLGNRSPKSMGKRAASVGSAGPHSVYSLNGLSIQETLNYTELCR